MALSLPSGAPTLLIRRESYERAGLTRAAIDERLSLTDQEFRVERDLVAIGPVYDADAFGQLVEELEQLGLAYFDDFVEMTGNWPEWLDVFVSAR